MTRERIEGFVLAVCVIIAILLMASVMTGTLGADMIAADAVGSRCGPELDYISITLGPNDLSKMDQVAQAFSDGDYDLILVIPMEFEEVNGGFETKWATAVGHCRLEWGS